MEYVDAEVIESHNDLDVLVTKLKKNKLIYRLIFLSLIVTWIFLIMLYFLLPAYRLESIKIEGLNLLEKNDIIYLSKYSENKHIIGINEDTFDSNLIERSDNIIIESNSNIGWFNSNTKVIEDIPIFYYNDRSYFLSQIDKDEYLNRINKNLSQESFFKIKSKINEIKDEDLIKVHFLKQYDKGLESEKEIAKVLKLFHGISLDTIKYIESIQFTSYFETKQTYSLCDVLLSDNEESFILKSIRYDTILDVFNSPKNVKNIIDSAKSVKNILNKIDYQYIDTSEVIKDLHELKVTVKDHHVRIYTY